MGNCRISVWKDEISLSLLQRYHDRGFLQDEIPTLPKSRQSLFIVKTVSKNRRKRPHFMKLLHPWHQKEKYMARKEKLLISQSISLISIDTKILNKT